MKKSIVLASSSPARLKILKAAGFFVTTRQVNIDEISTFQSPELFVKDIAEQKLTAALDSFPDVENVQILTADTCIFFNNSIIGKSSSPAEARNLLKQLSGQTHQVYTGIALNRPNQNRKSDYELTNIEFRNLTEEIIDWYINSGEWKNAAGSYRIQGKGLHLIKGVKGSYWNAAGLPIEKIFGILRRQDF
ncbi:MAG: Maf family protein [Spirochaetia bacterium]|nr:Maf family protein [Spirochaetia bacterium]